MDSLEIDVSARASGEVIIVFSENSSPRTTLTINPYGARWLASELIAAADRAEKSLSRWVVQNEKS